jgi:hypothetical protein
MTEHTCTPPDPVAYAAVAETSESRQAEYWVDPACGQWWYVTEDTCTECGRSDGPTWAKAAPLTQGPQQADGSHYHRKPPTTSWFTLPDISVARGGIRYGEPPPPPSDMYGPLAAGFLARDAAIKAHYERAAARYDAASLRLEYGHIVSAGGWCAPSEPLYDMGEHP